MLAGTFQTSFYKTTDTTFFFEAVLEAPVLGTLKNFEKIPVCGPCAVVCGDFEIFQSSPVCGPCGVVCGDFENFQNSHLCDSFAGDFEKFCYSGFPVCGLCAVVCEDFEFSKFPCV